VWLSASLDEDKLATANYLANFIGRKREGEREREI
jgi:hypothetical protein